MITEYNISGIHFLLWSLPDELRDFGQEVCEHRDGAGEVEDDEHLAPVGHAVDVAVPDLVNGEW